MKFILGKKIDMTQIWQGDNCLGVTRVAVGPCYVTQVKDEKNDGYKSIQLGYGVKKAKNITKPQKGHFGKIKAVKPDLDVNFRYVREFRIQDNKDATNEESILNLGDKVGIDTFQSGDRIDVTAISKGKGFQGVVKRHGFKGAIKTHGTKDQVRMPGSIGATGPARVFKGVRMAGQMGNKQITIKNLEIVDIDKENNILLINGSIPGGRNSLISIKAL